MNYKFLALLLVTAITASAQKKTEKIYSTKLGDDREITIVLPKHYQDTKDKAYPLLVVLDGDYLTDPFAGTLAYSEYWDDLPQTIIVGVHQAKGKRDDDSEYDENTGMPLEAGAAFYEFIAQELIPYMQEGYNIAPFKMIAGHNITAGFMNSFLYKDKPVFNAYIALSPVYPKNMETTLHQRLKVLKKPVYYYVATADGDVAGIRSQAKGLADSLAVSPSPTVKFRYDEYKETSHYSLPPQAIPEAVYHIFSYYQPISSKEYETRLLTIHNGHTQYLEDKYKGIEKELGFSIPIRINDFKAVEAAIMKNATYDEFKELAGLARKNYPKSIFGEYYTALFFEMTGDKKRAIKTYVNSYSLNKLGEYTKDFMMARAEKLQTEQ